MAQFPLLRLTRTGQEMTGMSQGGGKLTFVRVELGDGELKEGDSIETLTALKHGIMQLPLQGYQSEGNGKARLRFIVDNSALVAGFINREIGVFAKIENGAEQLYAYTNAGNYADWIPSKETPIDSDIVDLHIVIGNAPNVVIETSNGAYATKIDIEEHNKAPDAHADLRALIANAGIAILQRSRAYQVGDIAYHKALPSWARLECVRAGTTGAILPNLSGAHENDHITDGTVEWIVGKTATVEQLTKSLTGKADCSLGNILESAKTVIKDAVIVRSLLKENGYIVFANGLIVQWGSIAGQTITNPEQSTAFAPPLAISTELFSCGNVNIAGGNADVKWKTKSPVVSTILAGGLLNIACNYFYADWRYTIRWLLIGF